MKPKVSIVIPTYNHLEDCLRPCVDSLIKYTNGADKEIVISANGCVDGTKDYLDKLSKNNPDRFKVVWSGKPLGYSKATNAGLAVARGEYVVFLNNDIILLDQKKDDWINMMIAPFESDPKMGITGPLVGHSVTGRNFVIFFCAMTTRKIIDEVGLLDEQFGVGGGEDTDFCHRAEDVGYKIAQVPTSEQLRFAKGMGIGSFPIYHKGEATVNGIPGWDKIFKENSLRLLAKYPNEGQRKWVLSNHCERAVIGKDDEIPPRERTRYEWARDHLVGKKIIDIGCSSGYGYRMLKDIPGIEYHGLDKDEDVIAYAKQQFPEGDFICADINTFDFEKFGADTIIAYEVIEHLDNGREIAQKLKKCCKKLIMSTPYAEPVGFWGPHHRIHNLHEDDFPGFSYTYIGEHGELSDEPVHGIVCLMLMETCEEGKVVVKKRKPSGLDVTVELSTTGRHQTTLALVLHAILEQTVTPGKVIIYDDEVINERGEHRDLRPVDPYGKIFRRLSMKGINWEVKFSPGHGQVKNHEDARKTAMTKFVWRLDDDAVPEATCLERLLEPMADEKVGAVAGLVLDPEGSFDQTQASTKMQDISTHVNAQWCANFAGGEAEHLYSTFLYRVKAAQHGYNMRLSKVGHREETMFSHEMFLNGWKLLIIPGAKTWHYRCSGGGIRSGNDASLWSADEMVFTAWKNEKKVINDNAFWVVLDSGLGDHFMFLQILPEIIKENPDKNIILACCYSDVFKDFPQVKIVSIGHAREMLGAAIEEHSVYKRAWDLNWKGPFIDVFRRMYLKKNKDYTPLNIGEIVDHLACRFGYKSCLEIKPDCIFILENKP